MGTGAKLVAPNHPPTSADSARPDCTVPVTKGSFVTATLLVHVHEAPEPLRADTRALKCFPAASFVRPQDGVAAPEIDEHPAGKKFEATGTAFVHANH